MLLKIIGSIKMIAIPMEYKKIKTWRWLFNCAFDYLCIIGAMIIAEMLDQLLFYGIALIVIGARQHALTLLGHDGAHKLVSKKSWMNEPLWRIFCAWVFVLGPNAYRQFHFKHHRYVGTDKDPEIKNKRISNFWILPVSMQKMRITFFKDYCGIYLFQLKPFKTADVLLPTGIDLAGVIVLWATFISMVIVFDGWYYFFMWCFPMITTMWAVQRIRIWSEHTAISGTYRFQTNLWQRFLLFPHNTWCHWEHHKYPAIPFYYLPKIRQLDDSEKIFSSFADIVDIFSKSHAIASGEQGLCINNSNV